MINYMEMIGLKETGLDLLIQKGYKVLELDTYFTSGPEETRVDYSKKLYSSKSCWRNSY